MNREEAISKRIQDLSGDEFEDFAYGLLSRELYPGLTPTSRSGDEGEDAHTEWSTLFMHGGKWISVSASKDGSWTKLEADCQTCKQKGHNIDILVFAIAGNPQRDRTISRWKTDVKDKFGWELEIKPLNWFKSVASKPVHESFVNDHLGIPPPGGDFIQSIQSEFANITREVTAHIHTLIPGLDKPLPRPEIEQIENYLQQGVPVILVGDPGTGKSGIAKKLAVSSQRQQKAVLLLDARRVAHVHSEAELRREIPLKGPVKNAIERVGKHQGCRVIIDQFDNTIGYTSERILTKLAEDCCRLEGVEIVAIARPRGGAENLIETLKKLGFVSVISELLDEPIVVEVLKDRLKILNPAQELVTLGKSLLNLSLIGRIKEQQSAFDFSNPLDEIDLWEKFIEILEKREQIGPEPRKAQEIIEGAIEFARIGLNNPNRTFTLPHAHPYQRLISWQIIVPVEVKSLVFRFSHEQLQDFFYAWNAANEQLSPVAVINDIDPHKSRNVVE